MLVRINKPTGQNAQIDLLQQELAAHLASVFPALDPERACIYPAAYRNQAPEPGTGYIAEIYVGGGEYKEVYQDDTLALSSFFAVAPKLAHGPEDATEVALITFANLEELYPDAEHRPDYELRREFQRLFEAPIYGFQLKNVETGLQNVLREFPGSRRDGRLSAADMGKWHAFRLNLSLRFDRENCSL